MKFISRRSYLICLVGLRPGQAYHQGAGKHLGCAALHIFSSDFSCFSSLPVFLFYYDLISCSSKHVIWFFFLFFCHIRLDQTTIKQIKLAQTKLNRNELDQTFQI